MSKRNNIENHLNRIGQIVGMSRKEAISTIKTRRYRLLATAIMSIGVFAFAIGPIPGKYGGVSIQDFCWPWLF